MDSIMKKFTAERYPGERHAYSLAPTTFGTPMNFMGPGTRLDIRLDEKELPKPNSQPINKADYESYKHDLAYKHAKDDYMKNPTPENKKRQMNKVWSADNKFIKEMEQDHEEPIAPIAGKLMQLKKSGEQLGVLPTTTFSGFGAGHEEVDPVARLREIAEDHYKDDNKITRKKQKGGFAFLAPLAIAAGSALAGSLAKDLYEYVKKKVTGSGYKMKNHKTLKEKKLFLKEFVNNNI